MARVTSRAFFYAPKGGSFPGNGTDRPTGLAYNPIKKADK